MHTHARIVRTDAHIHIVKFLYEYDNDDINEKSQTYNNWLNNYKL